MNAKKTLPIALVTLLAAYAGASWWVGKQAEITLNKQHQLLADVPYFLVKSRTYERGWFTSTERTTIALNPTLAAPYLEMLKMAGENKPKLELSYTQTIKHGPLPLLFSGNPSPLKAAVVTDVQFSADSEKVLKKIFGEQKPLQIENRIQFGDDGSFAIKVPSFVYEETLAKVKSTWQGLDASISYGGDFNRVDIKLSAPGLSFEAANKGVLNIKGLSFESHNARGASGVMIGKGELKLASADFAQLENENGIKAKLDDLRYVVSTTEKGEFIDSHGDVDLKSFNLDGKQYGPAKLAVSAKHLHGPTLQALSKAVTRIQREVPEPKAQATAMFEAFKKQGLPLLRNDPALAIEQLSIKLPEGELALKADLSLHDFVDQDLDQPIKLLQKLKANADLKMPKQIIETYVLWQARSMIAVDTEEGEHPATEDLENLARNLMENQLRKLTEQNLIKAEGDMLTTSAKWDKGGLQVNGKAIALPWQAVK